MFWKKYEFLAKAQKLVMQRAESRNERPHLTISRILIKLGGVVAPIEIYLYNF